MKNNLFFKSKIFYKNSKLGALLPIALFLIVSIASITPFLIHNSEQSAERGIYNGEWAKIQWGLNGLRHSHAMGVNMGDNPGGITTIATISYGDFHVTASVIERKTLLGKNQCFSMTPMVYRGFGNNQDPYRDAGYNLEEITVTYDSVAGVAAGGNHSFAWKKDGSLYTWGRNNRGQLGVGNTIDVSSPKLVVNGNLLTPTGINNFNQGWLVAGGNETSVAVDYLGKLYATGKLGEVSGFLGTTNSEYVNSPLALGFNKETLDLASGNDYFAILGDNGIIYKQSWNSNIGKTNGVILPIDNLSDVKGLSGGKDHILAMTKNGDLWGYGTNANYQLGRSNINIIGLTKVNNSDIALLSEVKLEGTDKTGPGVEAKFILSEAYNIATFTIIADSVPRNESPFWMTTAYKDYISLQPINSSKGNPLKLMQLTSATLVKDKKYIWEFNVGARIEAGEYVVKLMTESIKTKFLGGQEAPKYTEINSKWFRNNATNSANYNKGVYSFYGAPAESPIGFIGVAAGGDFSLAIEKTDDQKTVLYSWGTNTYGQLGLGHNNVASAMTPVPNFPSANEKLLTISAGLSHVLALTEDKKVYSWGRNNFGQLGIGNTTNQNTPQLVAALANKKIISIAAGDNHSLAMDEDLNVYSWGQNNYGQLGNGNTSTNAQTTPITITLN
jgi:alpha-tubulin suppressor-like RCC1 family protein